MKGVSTLVVVILLLLITISLIGFVFIFFQRQVGAVTESVEEEAERATENLRKTVRIDNAAGTSVAVFHTGSVAISLATEVTAYVNNVVKTCTWSVGTLNPGGTATCTLNETCAAGADIKLTTPAGPVTEECE